MTSKARKERAPSPEETTTDSGEGSAVSKRRPTNYVRRAKASQAVDKVRAIPSVIFPQWLRTFLVAFLWMGSTPVYVSLISPYVAYMSAMVMTVGLIVFSSLAPHLWPSRTPPWRTVAWAGVMSMLAGLTVLGLEWGRYALVIATVVGFSIVIARANQNIRRLIDLFKTWRVMR